MNIIQKFYKITQLDVGLLLSDISVFIADHSSNIAASYSDRSITIDSSIYSEFEELSNRIDSFFTIFSKFKDSFSNLEFWPLLEQMENVHSFWQTVRNSPKWTRSSITTFGEYIYSNTVQYQAKQNESLNKIYRDRVGDSNSLDGWYDIAIQNKLTEDDYSIAEGGVSLQLSDNSSSQISFFVRDVVDTIQGKSAYGKDIDKNFSIDEDSQDIGVLDYDQTMIQSIKTLLTLGKEDNPYKPQDGLQKSLFIGGSSRAIFNTPILRRQLLSNFATDSTILDFQITNISFDQDNVMIEGVTKTILEELIDHKSSL